MSLKDKETKSLQDKLKQFFRLKGSAGGLRNRIDFSLTAEIERDICPDAPTHVRVKAIKELSEDVLTNRLEDNAVEKLWMNLQDLLQRDQPKELRQMSFTFMRCLIKGQYERLGVMRSQFFRLVKQHDHPEDITVRFDLMTALTLNGKDILYFEDEVGPFLLNWMSDVISIGRTQEFLELLVNVIKFNASYLDEEVITGLVQTTCILCCRSNGNQQQVVVHACLQVLDTVVCYSSLPTESLATFVGALCRTVNREEYCQDSWRIMRNLLGTHMGHSALYTMCRILQEPALRQDHLLLRGAVFHVNQALWGTRPLVSLRCTPTSVLPSFLHALNCDHHVVVYEVMVSVQGLVSRCGLDLQDPAWDAVLDIVEAVLKHVDHNSAAGSPIIVHFHETLDTIERLVESGQFSGNSTRVYALMEQCAPGRPESSVMRLLEHLSTEIVPTKHSWLNSLNGLMQRYFRQETRRAVRLRSLEILGTVVRLNRARYEDELVERIVVPHLQQITSDLDLVVRKKCADLLVNLCLECDNKRCGELLDILDRMLNRPFDLQSDAQQPGQQTESDIADVKSVVTGLIKLFCVKLHKLPSSHSVRIYRMLVDHVELHYRRPTMIENGGHIRHQIFDFLLRMRADSSYHVGCLELGNNVPRYSPYLCVAATRTISSPPPLTSDVTSGGAQQPGSNTSVTQVSLMPSFRVFISCLMQEKDWEVLSFVLQELPNLLQNRALVLSGRQATGVGELDQLAVALCSMLMEKSLGLPDTLRNIPNKFVRSDFQLAVLLVLSSLASYHSHLEPTSQHRAVRCMVKFGLVPRCSHQCITALTTCTLEMQDVMVKLLPQVLLDLSKISATVYIAIPVLEFLSTLTRLPVVFGNFVGDQYMAVFAISLPYTNPFKYNHYTVSLAHHVIAVWFLKCRLPFRRDFVRFITTGLQTNVLVPFEEGIANRATAVAELSAHLNNEDSSNRKRSSSLTEQGSRRRGERATLDLRPHADRTLLTFYEELTETCIDLMARYTFSLCSAMPKRLPTVDFLLASGQSMTWLLGNKLITVTTSGCSQKVLKHGLCDKCWLLCSHPLSDSSPTQQRQQARPPPCSCWCQGWAEIHIRRPTGDMSWVMRIQNQVGQHNGSNTDSLPLNELSSLFMPSLSKSEDDTPSVEWPSDGDGNGSTSRQNSKESADDDSDTMYEDGTKTRNPVRRSNSSPEMSASWKNPFMVSENRSGNNGDDDDNKKNKRVSCEAIPEEISSGLGTTPPTHSALSELSDSRLIPIPTSPRIHRSAYPVRSVDDSVTYSSRPPLTPSKQHPPLQQQQTVDIAIPPMRRDRGYTISVMSPVSKPRLDATQRVVRSPRPTKDVPRSGVSPSFVFLQLYHSAHFGNGSEKPLLVGSSQVVQRAVKILDRIPPYETHKIGVIYVGPGQCGNESEILRNRFGSVRYVEFLRRLGTLITLRNADPQTIFLGGLEQNGDDGRFAYVWQDDVMQVIFHVATLMPSKDSDPLCNDKKMHIGNDYVTIVYNESGEEYTIGTIKGQFNYASIVIQPLDHGTNRVVVKAKEELSEFVGHTDPKIISDQNLAVLARQLALHANLASMVTRSLKAHGQNPYASNWLERLRKIKHLRTKVMQENTVSTDLSEDASTVRSRRMQDFTEYT